MHRHFRWSARCFLSRSARLEFAIMSASEDLATSVANLQAAASAYQTAVQAKLAEPAAVVDDPNVVAANAAIVSVSDSLTAAAAALQPAPVVTETPAG